MASRDSSLPSLSNFEDDPVAAPTLTPRPRRSTPAPPPESAQRAAKPPVGEEPRRRGRPQTRPASQTATGFTRSSNVQVPSHLLGPIKARRAEENLTTGELIIAALEATVDQLPGLLQTRPMTGGGLFSPRASHVTRAADPLSSLNFRMRVEDFEVLDTLVDRFTAASRSQLVAAALTAYLT